jgi:hypothetical protein
MATVRTTVASEATRKSTSRSICHPIYIWNLYAVVLSLLSVTSP